MVMDRASDITLTTKDPFGTEIPNIGYTITGGRVLGTNPVTSATVYGFTQSGTTNASGEANYADESRGQYTVTITNANYDLYKLSPESPVANGFTAIAGSAADITAVLLDKSIGSLKITVQDQGSGNVLSGASVHVSNTTLGYDATVNTDQYGIAYFPTSLPALSDGTYDIEVTMAGYSNASSTASVNGALQTKTINMTP